MLAVLKASVLYIFCDLCHQMNDKTVADDELVHELMKLLKKSRQMEKRIACILAGDSNDQDGTKEDHMV